MNTYSGLDVHKGSAFACIIDEKRKKIFEKRFGKSRREVIIIGVSSAVDFGLSFSSVETLHATSIQQQCVATSPSMTKP
jgi:hypothetical protein